MPACFLASLFFGEVAKLEIDAPIFPEKI